MKSTDIFNCQKCGECCKGYGGTFITERDVRTIADYIGVAPENFVEKYCEMSGGRPVLARGSNGYCIFLDETCTIHPVKPRMCRAWPFIEGVRTDVNNWRIMASTCPGMRTDVPDDVILARVEKELLKEKP
ncbi:MAG: YkgJ family cysteine cluster protein [Desulfobacterales bacterium]|nr:YkgJ family cysteine cluster protein [Desulfobacterales bacterium]